MSKKKLENLGNRIDIALAYCNSSKIGIKRTSNVDNNNNIGVGFRVLSDLLSGILVGIFLGYNIDLYTGKMPLFIIIFTLLGFVAGVRNIYKASKDLENTKGKLKNG